MGGGLRGGLVRIVLCRRRGSLGGRFGGRGVGKGRGDFLLCVRCNEHALSLGFFNVMLNGLMSGLDGMGYEKGIYTHAWMGIGLVWMHWRNV